MPPYKKMVIYCMYDIHHTVCMIYKYTILQKMRVLNCEKNKHQLEKLTTIAKQYSLQICVLCQGQLLVKRLAKSTDSSKNKVGRLTPPNFKTLLKNSDQDLWCWHEIDTEVTEKEFKVQKWKEFRNSHIYGQLIFKKYVKIMIGKIVFFKEIVLKKTGYPHTNGWICTEFDTYILTKNESRNFKS